MNATSSCDVLIAGGGPVGSALSLGACRPRYFRRPHSRRSPRCRPTHRVFAWQSADSGSTGAWSSIPSTPIQKRACISARHFGRAFLRCEEHGLPRWAMSAPTRKCSGAACRDDARVAGMKLEGGRRGRRCPRDRRARNGDCGRDCWCLPTAARTLRENPADRSPPMDVDCPRKSAPDFRARRGSDCTAEGRWRCFLSGTIAPVVMHPRARKM